MNSAGVALIAQILREALAVSTLVAQANAEGRELAKEELDAARQRVRDSEERRDEAIDRAESEGR